MERHIMIEVFTKGMSIFEKVHPNVGIYFNMNGKKILGQLLRNYENTDCEAEIHDYTNLKVVRYSLVRYCEPKIKHGVKLKEDETIRFKSRDNAKHLLRLAIIKNNGGEIEVVLDNLLYVSECRCGMAVACIAKPKGSELVLLNQKAQITWRIGKRRDQMNKVDKATGLTNRQILKKMK